MSKKNHNKKIKKLYSACMFFDEIDGRQDVLVEWFRVGPRRKDVNYSQLIEDYELLNETDKSKAEEIVDEYFTKEEIEALRKFFKKTLRFQEHDLRVSQHSLPIQVKLPDNSGMFASLQEVSYGSNTLTPEHQGDLPFEVWGHFNVERHFPADELSHYHIHDGTVFLREALAIIFPDTCEERDNPERLAHVLREIYEKHGLFVGENNAKRWSSREKEA